MQKRIILFNGPPRSGKDTAASFIYSSNPFIHWFRMSQPLKDMVAAFFTLNSTDAKVIEQHKDNKLPLLFDNTFRDLQIWFSEECAKPKFGKDVFGRLARRRVEQSLSSLYICSDCGFVEEAIPLLDLVGPKNILIVQIHRDGCDFTKDSRSYITLPGVQTVKLVNQGHLRDYEYNVKAVVKAWLEAQES